MNDLAVKKTGTFRCWQNQPENEAQLQYVVEWKPAQTRTNLLIELQ